MCLVFSSLKPPNINQLAVNYSRKKHVLKKTRINYILRRFFISPYENIIYVFLCVPNYMFVHHICAGTLRANKRHKISWNWSHRWLLAYIWVLRTKPRTFASSASVLNYWLNCSPSYLEFSLFFFFSVYTVVTQTWGLHILDIISE